MSSPLPRLVAPRAAQTLEAVRTVTGGAFDIDAWHVMDERDNALITDEVMHGAGSDTFVYSFQVNNQEVSGVSVVGARYLAYHYRGLKHRIVGCVQKTGGLHEYRAFPNENFAGDTRATVVAELAGEPDYYACVAEVTDIKTGNTIMVETREERIGYNRDGVPYERPKYQTIAQSKAYRNAVLALIPQDVVIRWKAEQLRLKKGENITPSILEEKRAGVLRFAARSSVAIDRRRLENLTLDQIGGLGDAAREGRLPAFVNAASALGLTTTDEAAPPPSAPPPQQERRARGRPRRYPTNQPPPPPDDEPPPPTGELEPPPDGEPPPPGGRGNLQFEV